MKNFIKNVLLQFTKKSFWRETVPFIVVLYVIAVVGLELKPLFDHLNILESILVGIFMAIPAVVFSNKVDENTKKFFKE
jgi:hypothetical protein